MTSDQTPLWSTGRLPAVNNFTFRRKNIARWITRSGSHLGVIGDVLRIVLSGTEGGGAVTGDNRYCRFFDWRLRVLSIVAALKYRMPECLSYFLEHFPCCFMPSHMPYR
jgi:hypothetical protein